MYSLFIACLFCWSYCEEVLSEPVHQLVGSGPVKFAALGVCIVCTL